MRGRSSGNTARNSVSTRTSVSSAGLSTTWGMSREGNARVVGPARAAASVAAWSRAPIQRAMSEAAQRPTGDPPQQASGEHRDPWSEEVLSNTKPPNQAAHHPGPAFVGARREGERVSFRVWAPDHQRVQVVLLRRDGRGELATLGMEPE